MSKRYIDGLNAKIARLELQNLRLTEKVQMFMAAEPVRESRQIADLQQMLRQQAALRKVAERVGVHATFAFQNAVGCLSLHAPELAESLMSDFLATMNGIEVGVDDVKLRPVGEWTLDLFADSAPSEKTEAQQSETKDDPASEVPATGPNDAAAATTSSAAETPRKDKDESAAFGTPATAAQLERLQTTRNKGGSRKPRTLPEFQWDVHPDEADLTCACCGSSLTHAPSLARSATMLGCLPMEIATVSIVLHTYRCTECGHLESAIPPPRASEKGLCSLELGAWCACEKYDLHMPLHRTERRLDLLDAKLSAQNQFDMLAAMATALQPTYQGILRELQQTSSILHIDQTTWTNLQPRAVRDYQLWSISSPSLVWYGIELSKGRIVFDELLASFKGTIVADAASTHLSALNDPKQAWSLAVCWAHLLRKFRDIGDLVLPAVDAVERIQNIFDTDKKRPPDSDRSSIVPLVNDFFQWLRKSVVLPGSAFATACSYAINHEAQFRTFLTDPAIPMSNNVAERDIRPTVVGRHNHGGSRSPRGVIVAETFYTLCACARRHRVNPVDYIHVAIMRAREDQNAITMPWDVADYPHLRPSAFSISKNASRLKSD